MSLSFYWSFLNWESGIQKKKKKKHRPLVPKLYFARLEPTFNLASFHTCTWKASNVGILHPSSWPRGRRANHERADGKTRRPKQRPEQMRAFYYSCMSKHHWLLLTIETSCFRLPSAVFSSDVFICSSKPRNRSLSCWQNTTKYYKKKKKRQHFREPSRQKNASLSWLCCRQRMNINDDEVHLWDDWHEHKKK